MEKERYGARLKPEQMRQVIPRLTCLQFGQLRHELATPTALGLQALLSVDAAWHFAPKTFSIVNGPEAIVP
jgi:hypothetical protein